MGCKVWKRKLEEECKGAESGRVGLILDAPVFDGGGGVD